MQRRTRSWIASLLAAAAVLPAAGQLRVAEPIANGLTTSAFPTVGLLLNDVAGTCSGTLIGCSAFLTAAHCICDVRLSGEQCRSRSDLTDPARQLVFFQHAGFFEVQSVEVHPEYEFGTRGDLAVLRLARPVTGVRPSPVNGTGKPQPGTTGSIAGFGRAPDLDLPSGVKRAGEVTVAACTLPGLGRDAHVCWRFAAPLGPAGEDSTTCNGDSGGPLFVRQAGGLVVAGVTSGGFDCVPPDYAFDADVHRDLGWIASVAGRLGGASCGAGLVPADEPPTSYLAATDEAGAAALRYTVEVPPGARQLRVAVNAPVAPGHDLDLFLRHGAPAGPEHHDCRSNGAATLAYCQADDPQPGTWHVLVAPSLHGGSLVQTTATVLAAREAAGCDAGADAVYLGGGRFRVDACWTTGSGASGIAKLARQEGRGATLWFFDAANPELFLKVLDACGAPFDAHWVFIAGLTDVEVEVKVTDVVGGISKVYRNPQGRPFVSVQDTATFTACP